VSSHYESSHFASSHYLSSHYGRVEQPVYSGPVAGVGGGAVSAPGGGFAPYIGKVYPRRDPMPDEAYEDEEEMLIALCAAFLELLE